MARGSKLKCSKCGLKGAALGCYLRSCQKSYHVPCALEIDECRWDMVNALCSRIVDLPLSLFFLVFFGDMLFFLKVIHMFILSKLYRTIFFFCAPHIRQQDFQMKGLSLGRCLEIRLLYYKCKIFYLFSCFEMFNLYLFNLAWCFGILADSNI